MNRLAVFVEGYTEALFVERLINEIAGRKKVLIEQRKIFGGRNAPRSMITVRAAKKSSDKNFFVLLVDCGGDELVKTRIIEEHENLTKKGYSRIVGIRDVRPKYTHTEIPKLEQYLPKYIKTKLSPVTFILSIMEIEAWFLSEATHFQKIEPSITIEAIKLYLKFDPVKDNLELRLCPAIDLADCYSIGGKTYEKKKADITINALDYALIYLNISKKIKYLGLLITEIDTFLS